MKHLLRRCTVLTLSVLTAISFAMPGAYAETEVIPASPDVQTESRIVTTMPKRKDASGQAFRVINRNKPSFTKAQMNTRSFERYSRLDRLGRCGTAFANVSRKTMPAAERGSIGMVRPTGWHTVRYSNVPGRYLYNRCHLIGYQLTGENANPRNLITGTRYLNIEGMLPFENMVADYVKETGHHVLYRVKPKFKGNNLLASGVYMEAKSVEDKGRGVSFHVYCYNRQPGIKINYANGNSRQIGGASGTGSRVTTHHSGGSTGSGKSTYVYLSKTGTKFHRYSCHTLSRSRANRSIRKVKRSWAIRNGYQACKVCKP